jgi:GNAT superfamily N-acetyltransferase
MNLRLLNPENDAPAVVKMINSCEPEPITVDQFRGWCKHIPPGRDVRRMVAVDDRFQITGYSYVGHEAWEPAGKYEVWVVVQPLSRGQGIGDEILEEAIQYARSRGATLLTTYAREADRVSQGFVQRRGFTLERHQFESTLDLTKFDPAPFRAAEEAVTAAGIRIHSLAELGNTVENRRKLYEVNYAAALDIPGQTAWMPFEEFEQTVVGSAWFRPEGQLGALHGNRWIGLSAVQLFPEKRGAYNLITGVLREYRGHGIALALKLAALRYARANGATYIRTNNDSQNAPILGLNRKLGYIPLPGIYFYKKSSEKN